MLHYLREIRAVGFRSWFWFVVILKRDEFHPSLNGYAGSYKEFMKLAQKRDRAHRIDMTLMDLKEGLNG